MPLYAYAVLMAGWMAWVAPFVLAWRRRPRRKASQVDRRARVGVFLVGLSYAALWQTNFWERPVPLWRVALSTVCFVLADALSWTATRALGRQWRIDAALNADHELITAGPYGVVRHPIYTSMLCLLCASGLLLTPLPLLLAAVVVLIAGTEIRVRIEDRMLEERFGDRAREYRSRVAAYVPFLR